jgi:hypothetical protein
MCAAFRPPKSGLDENSEDPFPLPKGGLDKNSTSLIASLHEAINDERIERAYKDTVIESITWKEKQAAPQSIKLILNGHLLNDRLNMFHDYKNCVDKGFDDLGKKARDVYEEWNKLGLSNATTIPHPPLRRRPPPPPPPPKHHQMSITISNAADTAAMPGVENPMRATKMHSSERRGAGAAATNTALRKNDVVHI